MFYYRSLLILPVLLTVAPLFAQTSVSGKIVNSKNGDPISTANVGLPTVGEYVFSDDEGYFFLESEENDSILEVSADGFGLIEITLESNHVQDLVVEMTADKTMAQDSTVELESLTLTGKRKKYKNKKENPAYGIMREVWARRKTNGLAIVPYYEYEEYEKLEFDINNIDSAFINNKAFKKMEFIFERVDTSDITGKAYLPIFLNESISKVYGKNEVPKKERVDLIANQNSGFSDNEIVTQTAKDLYRKYNIYDNRLNFFNINFVSPIATDGFAVYEYELSDTLVIDGVEAYHIKYYPKRTGEFTFRGDFYISTKGYAVKEIAMESTRSLNVNFVRDIFVSQIFDVKDDTIFYPKRDYMLIDMTLLNKKDDAKGMFAHRTVRYKDFKFDHPRPDEFYNSRNYDPYMEGAFEKDEQFWLDARPEKLNRNEVGIYEMLDSLQQVRKFRTIVKGVEIFASGYWNVGNAIDIGDLYSTFGYNKIEGFRLRTGARTFFSNNDMWRAAFYVAYGFRDNKFKYGTELRYMFNKFNRFQVGVGTKRDIEQLGAQLTLSDGIMNRSFGSSSILSQSENDKLSNINKTNIYTSIDPWTNFTVRLDGNYQTIKSAEQSLFRIDYEKDGVLHDRLTDTNVSLSLIARPGARFSEYGIDRYEHTSAMAPTIMLRYTRGFSGLFHGGFDYDKLQLMYNQTILVGSFGRSNITLEAGRIFNAVPLSLLSIIPGNQSYGIIPGTFSQLDYYEFVTDTYSTLIIDHHFKGWVLNKVPLIKKLKWREVAFLRAAWGDISEQSIDMNRSDVNYLAPKNRIYYEYGFGIENIGFGNIRPLRVNFNWRGNYLEAPNARNFGVTIGMDFSF